MDLFKKSKPLLEEELKFFNQKSQKWQDAVLRYKSGGKVEYKLKVIIYAYASSSFPVIYKTI